MWTAVRRAPRSVGTAVLYLFILLMAQLVAVAVWGALRGGWGFFLDYVTVLPGFLAIYGYNLLLYPLLALILLVPVYGTRAPGAFLLVWSLNELLFNSLFALFHPGYVQVTEAINPSWPTYMAAMPVLLVAGLAWLRPRVVLSLYSLVLPVFLWTWVWAGEPLMRDMMLRASKPNAANFPWELALQVSLFLFVWGTFHPRERTDESIPASATAESTETGRKERMN